MEYLKDVLLDHAEVATAKIERGLGKHRTPIESPGKGSEELPSLKSRMRSNLRGPARTVSEHSIKEEEGEDDVPSIKKPDLNKPVPQLPIFSRTPKDPYATMSGARSNPNLASKNEEEASAIFKPLQVRKQASITFTDPFAPGHQHARTESDLNPDKSPKSRKNSFLSDEKPNLDKAVPPVPQLPSYATMHDKAPTRPPPLPLYNKAPHKKPLPPLARSTFPQISQTLLPPRGSSVFPSTSLSKGVEEPYPAREALQESRPSPSSSLGTNEDVEEQRQRFRSSLHITTSVEDVGAKEAVEISPSVYEDEIDDDQVAEMVALFPSSTSPQQMTGRMSNVDWAGDMPHTAPLSGQRSSATSAYSEERHAATLSEDNEPPHPSPQRPLSKDDLARLEDENKRIPYLILQSKSSIDRPKHEKTELDAYVPDAEADSEDEIYERVEKVRRKMQWYNENVEAKGKKLLKEEPKEETPGKEGSSRDAGKEWLRKVGRRERK